MNCSNVELVFLIALVFVGICIAAVYAKNSLFVSFGIVMRTIQEDGLVASMKSTVPKDVLLSGAMPRCVKGMLRRVVGAICVETRNNIN